MTYPSNAQLQIMRHIQDAGNALSVTRPGEERVETARREIAAANRLVANLEVGFAALPEKAPADPAGDGQ
jgi:hypothetical protein